MLNRAHIKSHYLPVLRLSALLLLVLVVLSYLWQVNSVATTGYKVKELERRISILQQRNAKLRWQAAELGALSRVEEKSKELGMVSNDQVDYLLDSKSEVALGR